MDLSPPALTSLFGAALWYFKAVVLSGHLTWNIIQSVPQVACSWNSDSINQVRGNLRRGSCHLGSHQQKKEQLLRNGHVSAHWQQKKTAHYNLIECQEHLCFHPICFTALIHQQRASTCQPTASTVNRKKQSDCTLQPNGSPSTLPAAKDGLRLQEATQRCQKLR